MLELLNYRLGKTKKVVRTTNEVPGASGDVSATVTEVFYVPIGEVVPLHPEKSDAHPFS